MGTDENSTRERLSRRGLAQAGTIGTAVVASALTGGPAPAQAQAQVQAQGVPISTTRPTITLPAAQALLAAAVARAQEIGVPMSVAVVDESGVLKAFARMEGNSLASVEIVQAKAFTAAAFRTPTHVLAERNQDDPVRIASLTDLPRVTLLGGGLPITHENGVIGGIGVGGGSPQQDIDVAEAALSALR